MTLRWRKPPPNHRLDLTPPTFELGIEFTGHRFKANYTADGHVAELADAMDLGSIGVIRVGSTPIVPTIPLVHKEYFRNPDHESIISFNGRMKTFQPTHFSAVSSASDLL